MTGLVDDAKERIKEFEFMLRWLVAYLQYWFLASVVVTMFVVLMIITDATIGLDQLSFGWLESLAIFMSPSARESLSLSISDLMMLVNLAALVLLLVGKLLSYGLHRLTSRTIKIGFIHRLLFGYAIIVIIFATGLLTLPRISPAEMADKGPLYLLLAVFGGIALINYSLYAALTLVRFPLFSKTNN